MVTEVVEDFMKISYHAEKILFSDKSEFQKVEIVQTKKFGRMLFNDNLLMISELDEHIYHDMIAHVPIFTHPNPRSVLIIGGGDGGTLREVLRHKNIDEVVMVEIDKMVVDACKKYIPQTSASMDNSRAQVLIDDGVQYMSQTEKQFDLIIIDSTDPIGPATPLFGKEFYKNVNRVLRDDGIVVAQGESPHYCTEIQRSLLKIQSEIFPLCHVYNFTNLTYPGGLWSFTLSSKKYSPIKDVSFNRIEESGLDFSYYSYLVHKASFCLPNFMLKNLSDFLTPVEKNKF